MYWCEPCSPTTYIEMEGKAQNPQR